MPSVDICIHATGGYIDYALRLTATLRRFAFSGWRRRVLIFTDKPDAFHHFPNSSDFRVEAIEVPNRPWPAASLMRFADYARHQDELVSDVTMCMDADMEVVDHFGAELNPSRWKTGIALVQHPGFFDGGIRIGRMAAVKHLITRRLTGPPRGSWETDSSSRAFVPEEGRRVYVCGGVWFGERVQAVSLCEMLSARIESDMSQGVTAVWHDESHLNWWASRFSPTVLPPEYCFVPSYPHLVGLKPRIVAVDKPQSFVSEVKGPGYRD